MKNNLPKILAVLIIFLLLLSVLTGLVMPKYSETLTEGSMLSQYYSEAGNHQIIFLGDCEVYANYNPLIIFEETGITSYIRGSSQQLLWQSYYVLEETLNTETPRAVVFNVSAMKFSQPVKEEYNRLCMDYMKWSASKLKMIQASMTEDESLLSYVFPILRYHSRIFSLTGEDFRYLFGIKKNTINGHLINTSVVPMENLPAKRNLSSYDFADICFDYLDRIRELCSENGVELILVKAPSQYPYWYEEYDAQIVSYAEKHGLKYYNFLNYVEEIGLDYSTDTYDAGLHLNESGAVKLSVFFAGKLAEDLEGLEDLRSDENTMREYSELRARYNRLLAEAD